MARGTPAPLIAVTGPSRGGLAPRWLVALALRLAGARPLMLKPDRPRPDVRVDGVVITGGHDVDPVLYAAAPEVTPKYDPARDRTTGLYRTFPGTTDTELYGVGYEVRRIISGVRLV